MIGTIKKLVSDKAFGFISVEGFVKDIFFHSNVLSGVAFAELREGDAVTFDTEDITQHILANRLSRDDARKLRECNAELVAYLSKYPDALLDLHPGTFENVVAEIFRHDGFATERISRWNQADGGVDLIAVRSISADLDFRVAVQCKMTHGRGVSAEPMRSLHSVLDRNPYRAHAGVVATTGVFTEHAIEETNEHMWRISLRDYNDILRSLNQMNLKSGVRLMLAAYSVGRA